MNRFLPALFVLTLTAAPALAQQWYDPVTGQPVSQQQADSFSYPAYPASPAEPSYQTPPQDVAPESGPRAASGDDILFSGEVGVVTDYRHRGISRSDEGPALQGNVKLGYHGVYGGVAGSTVDFDGDDATIEAAFFGGYKGTHETGIDYDGRLSYYAYPGSEDDDLDYWEFAITGGYDFDVFYGSVTWAASPDYFNDSGMSLYYGGDVVAPLPIGGLDLTAHGHLGFQFLDDEGNYAEDPMDWLVGLNYNWPEYDVDFGLSYTGTDADDDDCVLDCGSQLMLSAGKTIGWSR